MENLKRKSAGGRVSTFCMSGIIVNGITDCIDNIMFQCLKEGRIKKQTVSPMLVDINLLFYFFFFWLKTGTVPIFS